MKGKGAGWVGLGLGRTTIEGLMHRVGTKIRLRLGLNQGWGEIGIELWS